MTALLIGVFVDVTLEFWVLDERDVARQHHQVAARVLVLKFPSLEIGFPFQAFEKDKVGIVEQQWGASPRSDVARRVGVASTERVRARERDDVLVVEAHAIKDVSQALLRLGTRAIALVRGRQAPIWGHRRRIELVHASIRKLELWSAHFLDGYHADVRDEIRPGNIRVTLLNRFKLLHRLIEPSVTTVREFFLEPNRTTARTASVCHSIVRPGRVPRQAHHRRAEILVARHELRNIHAKRRERRLRGLHCRCSFFHSLGRRRRRRRRLGIDDNRRDARLFALGFRHKLSLRRTQRTHRHRQRHQRHQRLTTTRRHRVPHARRVLIRARAHAKKRATMSRLRCDRCRSRARDGAHRCARRRRHRQTRCRQHRRSVIGAMRCNAWPSRCDDGSSED